MKSFCLAALLLFAQSPQQTNILTVEQVLSWRAYYGLALDKDVSEAIGVFGEPNESGRSSRTWNPSPRTGFRRILVNLGPSPTRGPATVLRVTIYPHPSDVLAVQELLHSPEKFIFESGTNKQGSYFSAETRDREIRLVYLCGPGHDPQLQSITLKSGAPTDPL